MPKIPTRPAMVDLWVVAAAEGVAIERLQDRLGHPLPRSARTTMPDVYRYAEVFACGAILPPDIPADRIRRWAADGAILKVAVPLPESEN